MNPPGAVTFSSDLPKYDNIGSGGRKYTVPVKNGGEYKIHFKAEGSLILAMVSVFMP